MNEPVERITFDLLAEPVGELYYGLLDAARVECELALLVWYGARPVPEDHPLLQQLQPFLLRAVESGEWPGTQMLAPRTSPVLWYDYNADSAEVLKRATDRLYGWGWRWGRPDLPHDLCLLRDEDDVWLGTVSHEHYGWLCLSLEEKVRLVGVLPRIGPMLGDARRREESKSPSLQVQRFLNAWDPHGSLRDDPANDADEGWYGPEAEAILYVLSSAEVGSVVELADYIAAMVARWWRYEYADLVTWDCLGLAQTLWAWWEEWQSGRHE